MNIEAEMDQPRAELAARAVKGLAWSGVAIAALIFLPAWSLTFRAGWVVWALFMASVLAITLYFLRRDPDLIERRMKSGPTAEREPTQRRVQAVTSVLFLAAFVLPSLDHRFGWSFVPIGVLLLGDSLIVVGFAVVFRVFQENSFASSIIEVGAGQEVVSTGPYALVRHPMYSGALLMITGVPLGLGSLWGLAPVVLLWGALAWRLLDEERFLLIHLKGYEAYLREVRWRLAPGLW
jgi:protein-S-isoprenylcysteine O-methyltransferase Ste14